MRPLGPKIAEGRDSEIYAHGTGRVLRVARDGRSLVAEAEVMRHVAASGFPVPTVHDAGEGWLEMDRVEGPTMLDAAASRPHRLAAYARVLAGLHSSLHAITAPAWLPAAPLEGPAVLHRDLHPLNVLMSPDGPVVIDWANAARGDADWDVADTWVLLATATAPGPPWKRVVVGAGRRVLLRSFLSALSPPSGPAIAAVVEHRAADPNMSHAEIARMRAFAQAHGGSRS